MTATARPTAQTVSGKQASCTISPQQVCCKGKCLDTPVVIGIAVGGSCGLILICALVIGLCCRRRQRRGGDGDAPKQSVKLSVHETKGFV